MAIKKTSNKKKWIIKILFIAWVLITLFLLIWNPLAFITFHKFGMSLVGCEGIEKYYTGAGFEQDYSILKEDYDKSYTGGLSIFPRKISTLGGGGHFDCNDFSNAVMCLAEKYDLECKPVFYLMTGNGGWLGLYGTHFKTACENGEVYD